MAKLIVWGGDRRAAIDRMTGRWTSSVSQASRRRSPFHRAVMRHPDFIAGRLSTAFVERAFAGGNGLAVPSRDRARAAAVAVALRRASAHPSCRHPPPGRLGGHGEPAGSGAPRR
jgi:acetyl/propionyl-CoA carboxylase alpha subunit